jgi:hypothetical protein
MKKVTDKKAYGEGYQDAKHGFNATGKNDSYDEGWIRGYQDLRNISWERRYGYQK